jgi:hypothetical protein
MAEQKTQGEAAPSATTEPAKPTGKSTITKKEAVRRSLQKLGADAATADIQADIKKRFGFEMTTNHISTTKGELRKQASKNAAAVQAEETKPAAAQTAKRAASGKGPAVAMQDVLTLKELVGRVGADHLKILIEVMSR